MNRTFALAAATSLAAANLLLATGDWATAPQGLDHYTGRLPAKSFPELIQQAGLASFAAPELDATSAAAHLEEIADSLAETPREKSLSACETFLERARRSPGLPAGWINLGLDLRDALADSLTKDSDAASYIRWRIGLGPLSGDDAAAQRTAVKERLDRTTGRAAANLHYLLGAVDFLTYDGDKGEAAFSEMMEKYPDHPRAETAAFMLGRARLEHSREVFSDDALLQKLLNGASAAFAHYLKTYPQGRYAGDVLGWQGAVAVKRDEWASALDYYLQQMDLTVHPENQRSASRMVERVISRILAQPDEAPLRAIAKRPAVAMGTVYWILHAPEADLHNGFYDKPEAVKKWRSWWLPRLAAAVQAEPDAWKDQAARIWFTAILAHAASDAGDQASALKVLQEAGDAVTNSDDLAFARCVVLQRQGKDHPAEIEAWKTFLHGFPKSPLHDGAILRLATTQQAAGLCDDAVLTVASLQDREKGDTAIEDYFGQSFYPSDYTDLPPAASALSPSLTLAEPVQVAQHLDALLAFAPVEQLARLASRRSQFTPERWEQVRAVILGRLLSEGVTQEVATFLPKDGDRAAAEQIAGLAAKAKTDGTADAWIALGDAWAAARGRVTFQPMWSNRAEIYQEVNSDDPERLRNQNAVTLGLQDEAHAGNRLLAIDELANAKTAWEAALAKATPGSAQQAHALGQILEAMPKIAAAHPWARDFAARNGWSDSAAAFYATLQKDCASSPEARRAARPSFVNPDQAAQPAPEPPAANTANGKPLPDAFVQPAVEWTQPHYDFGIPYLKHREFIYPDLANLGEAAEPAAGEQLEDFNVLLQDLYAIDFAGRGARRQLESLRDRSRKSYRIWNEGCVHSAIEDLTALTADPSVTPVVLARYASLRLAVINVSAFLVSLELRPVHGDLVTGPEADEWVFQALTKAMTEPALKSVADRIGCLRLLVLANRTISIPVTGADDNKEGESTIETRDYAAVEKEALAWLKAFPKSAKRQEAWLLCVRAAYRARRPLLRSVGANFPESGTSVGSLYVRLPQPNLLPWNPGIIESRIAAYEKEFPSPRYAAELNDLRSGLAVAKKDWPRAIALCTALLHDPQHPDLHLEAALRLTNLFARLGDPEVRPDLLAAIKESPAARADLVRYLDATDESTDLEPLTFWTAWLREQVTQS